MQLSLFIVVLFCIHTHQLCTSHSNTGWMSDYSKIRYTSVNTITTVDLNTVCPYINTTKVPGHTPQEYLQPQSCLGYSGPLGPEGPLGSLGPIGNRLWNASNTVFDYGSLSFGGSLDKDGPLGYKGAVSTQQYYGLKNPGKALFESNDFAVQLRGLGLWSALGTIGPLGPLGVLGPLGPLGNFIADLNGNYWLNGQIVTNVTIDYDGTNSNDRTYPLYEVYSDTYVQDKVLDTSFMIQGYLSGSGESDHFNIGAQSIDQIVTIVVVPLMQMDQFELVAYSSDGKQIGSTSTAGYVQTLQLTIPEGFSFNIVIRSIYTGSLMGTNYRLTVTGSTQYLNQYNIDGDQITFFN